MEALGLVRADHHIVARGTGVNGSDRFDRSNGSEASGLVRVDGLGLVDVLDEALGAVEGSHPEPEPHILVGRRVREPHPEGRLLRLSSAAAVEVAHEVHVAALRHSHRLAIPASLPHEDRIGPVQPTDLLVHRDSAHHGHLELVQRVRFDDRLPRLGELHQECCRRRSGELAQERDVGSRNGDAVLALAGVGGLLLEHPHELPGPHRLFGRDGCSRQLCNEQSEDSDNPDPAPHCHLPGSEPRSPSGPGHDLTVLARLNYGKRQRSGPLAVR